MKKFKLQKNVLLIFLLVMIAVSCYMGIPIRPLLTGYADPTSYERCVCIITSSDAECQEWDLTSECQSGS